MNLAIGSQQATLQNKVVSNDMISLSCLTWLLSSISSETNQLLFNSHGEVKAMERAFRRNDDSHCANHHFASST